MSNVWVHVAFDDYPQPSLKDAERARRGTTAEDSRSYIITGPAQRRPNDISKVLTSRSFKRELPDFLAREWQDQANAHILGNCNFFLDVPSGQCFHFHVSEGEVKRDSYRSSPGSSPGVAAPILKHQIICPFTRCINSSPKT